MNLVDTLSQAFNKAVADIVNAIPILIGALLILLIGWIVGRIVGGIVTGVLGRAGADGLFARYAGSIYGDKPGSATPSQHLGVLVKWLIYLVFFLSAANFLGWSQVSLLISQFVEWLPNLIVAIIIILAAPVLGRMLRGAIDASGEGLGLSNTNLLGRLAEFAVIAFGVIIALYQVGVASDLVNILFIGVVLAMALAFGLAFGLGGRAVAEEMSRNWYARSKELTAKIAETPEVSAAGAPSPARRADPPASQR